MFILKKLGENTPDGKKTTFELTLTPEDYVLQFRIDGEVKILNLNT